jgi:signal transduction histidine kinase
MEPMHRHEECSAIIGDLSVAHGHEMRAQDSSISRIAANSCEDPRLCAPLIALEVVTAVSRQLGQAPDLPAFFGRLSETVAGLVGARRAAFWRLKPNNTLEAQPDAFGFSPAALSSMAVQLDPAGSSIPERVVFQDRVHVGRRDPVELAQYRAALDAMGVRNAVAVSWCAGDTILGSLAAYDADRDFEEADIWVLRIASRTAGLVWQCQEARAAVRHSAALVQAFTAERDRLFGELVTAAEFERSQIASDIHDDALQYLTAAELSLRRVRRRTAHLDGVHEFVTTAEEMLQRTDASLRRIVTGVAPTILRGPDALERAVDARVGVLRLTTGITCRSEVTLTRALCSETADAAFRIIHGALSNVARHSRADTAVVRISGDENGVALCVQDDGCGFAAETHEPRPGHIGIASMKRRAESTGGWASVRGEVGKGTTVEAWLPL